MEDKYGNVKNGIFCIMVFITILMTSLGIVAIGRYQKQCSEIEKLQKEIENQQMLIDLLKESDK